LNIENYTKQFFADLPILPDISDKYLEEFVKAINIRSYDKGENLFFRGDPADRFFIILSGWVKLYRITEEGNESVVSILNRGKTLGKTIIFSEKDYQFSASVIEAASVIEIPIKTFRDIIIKDKMVMKSLMSLMERELRYRQMEAEHLAVMNTPQRLGCLILKLFSKLNIDNDVMAFPYDKSLAAARLGMKPETFSRALYQLRSLGVYSKGSAISINSLENLKEFSCSHCSSLDGECMGSKEEDYKSDSCGCKKL